MENDFLERGLDTDSRAQRKELVAGTERCQWAVMRAAGLATLDVLSRAGTGEWTRIWH